jgi:hypothetical protein
MPALLLSAGLVLTASACKKEPPNPVARPARRAPVKPGPKTTIVVGKAGAAQARAVGGNTKLARLARKVLASKAGPIPANVRRAAKDPAKLVGRWRVLHTIYRTNGRSRGPSKPLAPTTWTFGKDGSFLVKGGMTIRGRYVYTGDALHVSAIGPTTRYAIGKQTATELEVTSTIAAGSVRIVNTTALRRASGK